MTGVIHPVSLVLLSLLAVSLVLMGRASLTSLRVVLGWAPQSDSRVQLRLERDAEAQGHASRWAFWTLLAASLVTGVHVSSVLPALVPGAMCGTGVLQASTPHGVRALLMGFLALAGLGAHRVVDQLNLRSPRGVLTLLGARVQLAVLPLVVLWVWTLATMLWSLDVHEPVDCCAALYEAVAAGQRPLSRVPDGVWMVSLAVLSLPLLASSVAALVKPGSRVGRILLSVLSLLWVAPALGATVHVFAPLHFGVLHHHCAWCLLLPEHSLVGFPLFASVAVVALHGPAALIAQRAARSHPRLAPAVWHRTRIAACAVLLAQAVYWGHSTPVFPLLFR